MLAKMSTRDRRAIYAGVVGAGLILLFHYVIGPWQDVRADIAKKQAEIATIRALRDPDAKVLGAFEMPEIEDIQRVLFERKFSEQLQKAGVGAVAPPEYTYKGKEENSLGVKLLRMECKGKCKFNQAMDLLVKLDENPYLVGIEAMKLTCGEPKREHMELDLTVSTFVREAEAVK